MPWPRPVPLVGDPTSAAQRAADPTGWAMGAADVDALHRVLRGRRDIRRYRPDPVPEAVLTRVLGAAHAAPSVGHSQPWRFVVVEDASTRQRAATLADEQRLVQAAAMDADAGRHLLDLDLEGIREAPLGLVVCCDRRAPAAGVLGRATYGDADLWSCACAIENLWLAARVEGLGVGWVTLFRPGDLAELVGAPAGVETLGWLCLGWPDERPPDPGLERRGWSSRLPLAAVVHRGRWPETGATPPPPSRLAPAAAPGPEGVLAPGPEAVVAARDGADRMLTTPGSLGALDRAVDRLHALGVVAAAGGTLVLAAADHPVTVHGVSAFAQDVTRHVAGAALLGEALGVVAAAAAGLGAVVVDAGVDGGPLAAPPGGAVELVHIRPAGRRGDLVGADALTPEDAAALLDGGRALGARLGAAGAAVPPPPGAGRLVALGEAGVGNTTPAAALAAALLDLDPAAAAGLGAGADRHMLGVKAAVLRRALDRAGAGRDPLQLLAALGGGELAVLAGVALGVAATGGAVVLDGLATSVAALVAVRLEPAVAAHLLAGQRSREAAHGPVLAALGLEPLLDLRIRAGEGAGAALACGLLGAALRVRAATATTA